jgi:hypothetical protein
MSNGHNWRNTLSSFASISAVLAGFCITFMALIVGNRVADVSVFESGLTYGQVAVLFFGISSSFFISAAELFLYAKENDIDEVPERSKELLRKKIERQGEEWLKFEDRTIERCQNSEKWGRRFYNFAIFVISFGLFSTLAPFSKEVAVAIFLLWVALQFWQYRR